MHSGGRCTGTARETQTRLARRGSKIGRLAQGKIDADTAVTGGRGLEAMHSEHRKVDLDTVELLKISTWLDANCQYYCSYWGRRHVKHRSDPAFRPRVTFEQATDTTPPDWAEKK